MNKQQLYLKKLENDIEEKIYDLLITHLQEVHIVIPKTNQNQQYLNQLYNLLTKALNDLDKYSNKFNYLQHYRYSLLIINTFLTYTPEQHQLKQKKLEILNKFSSTIHYDTNEKIPLNSQMSELRITHDARYLIHLLEKYLIPQKQWDKAAYCLMAIELVEPDHDNLNFYKEQLKHHLNQQPLEYIQPEEPYNTTILLDTNIVINKIFYDVGEYKIPHLKQEYYNKLMESWGNNNKFAITTSTKEEIEKHLNFTIEQIKQKKIQNKTEIIQTLEKRYTNIIKKYHIQTSIENTKEIEEFYKNYLGNLYEITQEKIENKKLSIKLKKLSQREGLLPERGDLQLLKEAISLKGNIAILTNDKDLYLFNQELEKKFGIKVYN